MTIHAPHQPRAPMRVRRQDGSFAVLFVSILSLLIACCAFAMDVGPLYNRKVELQGIARAAALAASGKLNGTAAGLAAARASARAAAERLVYRYKLPVAWSDGALSFASAPDRYGSWTPSTVAADPTALYYARVDTAALGPGTGEVTNVFMSIASATLSRASLADSAIAGRIDIDVTPLAVCAMSPQAAAPRANPGAPADELVEYGFRRGVSYDLMQLNPDGDKPVRFLVNPYVLPGTDKTASLDPSTNGPLLCAGNMWMPRLAGGTIQVSSLPANGPLNSIYMHLNSRFDQYTSYLCTPNGGPPDFNVKAYAHNAAGGTPWMLPAIGNLAAQTTQVRGRLETIADLPAPPAGTTAAAYGPLWAYAAAASHAPSQPGAAGAAFGPADWPALYPSGPTASGYPTAVAAPYHASSGPTYAAPGGAHLDMATAQRRVLNIPLLACPVSAGANVKATPLAVGRFFMTVPADSNRLVAEFAGVLPLSSLIGKVELFP